MTGVHRAKRLLFFVTFLIAFIVTQGSLSHGEDGTVSFNIIATGDLHSHLFPDSLGRGGITKVASIVKEMKRQDPHTLVFDLGDFVEGTIFFQKFLGKIEYETLSQLPYDAIIPGGHEFTAGPAIYAEAVKYAQKIPVLCTNLTRDSIEKFDSHNPDLPLKNRIQPYMVKNVKGVTIGIIGVTSPDSNITHQPLPLKFFDPFKEKEVVRKTIDELSARTDIIIVLSHLGSHMDRRLASEFTSIDLILGAHTHIPFFMPEMVLSSGNKHGVKLGNEGQGGVLITNSGPYGRYVAHTKLHYDIAEKRIKGWDYRLISLDEGVEEDREVKDHILKHAESGKDRTDWFTDFQDISIHTDLRGEMEDLQIMQNNFGNIIADAYMEYGRRFFGNEMPGVIKKLKSPFFTIGFEAGTIKSSTLKGTRNGEYIFNAVPMGLPGGDISHSFTEHRSDEHRFNIEEGKILPGQSDRESGRFLIDKVRLFGSRLVSIDLDFYSLITALNLSLTLGEEGGFPRLSRNVQLTANLKTPSKNKIIPDLMMMMPDVPMDIDGNGELGFERLLDYRVFSSKKYGGKFDKPLIPAIISSVQRYDERFKGQKPLLEKKPFKLWQRNAIKAERIFRVITSELLLAGILRLMDTDKKFTFSYGNLQILPETQFEVLYRHLKENRYLESSINESERVKLFTPVRPIINGLFSPYPNPARRGKNVLFSVLINDQNKSDNIKSVKIDLTSLGKDFIEMKSSTGLSAGFAGTLYSADVELSPGIKTGLYHISVIVESMEFQSNSTEGKFIFMVE